MAEDRRRSGSSGPLILRSKKRLMRGAIIGSGGPVITGSMMRFGRSPMTGRFVEGTGARRQEDMKILKTRSTADGVAETSSRSGWVGRSGRAAERVEAVMRGAAEEGLTLAKTGRIAGRVSAELIAAAKARTGLQSDTELVEFALANVALEDDFAQIFRDVRGTVDPDLGLAF